jgi:2-polyprenyl-3-methyl-5-hydroxy-6-metoxy-1,4-benzoquinol methylase
MTKKRRRRPIPLTAISTVVSSSSSSSISNVIKSRRRARQVTTMFHKYTRQRDLAQQKGDTVIVHECNEKLQQMGGRISYQQASQLSTKYHSISKTWVLGHLARNGWLYGIKSVDTNCSTGTTSNMTAKEQRQIPRRTTRILEVGAINTDLLDAAAAAAAAVTTTTNEVVTHDIEASSSSLCKQKKKIYNIHVRSIDLHAMDARIEEADFLELPYLHPTDITQRYDVIVCSMVLNCVTTPQDRGKMLCRLYHHLRPGGLCFLTIPKFCLTKSAFVTPTLFQQLLTQTKSRSGGGVGFAIESTKDTPRISYFLLKRPQDVNGTNETRIKILNPQWTRQVIRNKGKKFPNQFSVVLQPQYVLDEDPPTPTTT